MPNPTRPVITRAEDRPREVWDDPTRGGVAWYTLFSRDVTPTEGLTVGIADCPAGGALNTHRHAQPEVYYILEGQGTMWIDGTETTVKPGDAIFIPGDAEHGIVPVGDDRLRLLYVFPTDSFSEVVYRFPTDGS